jgi:hypothetical protein
MAKIHIGKKIREVVDKSNFSIVDFARSINLSRDGAYKIFAKEYIDTQQLKKISKVLKHDFFVYYSADLSETKEPREKYGYVTKDDFETLKRMVEALSRKFDEHFPEKPGAKAYKTKPRKTSVKAK